GRRRGADDGDEGEDAGAGRRGRRERPQKKKSPVPMIAAAVVVIGGGIGGYMAMTSGGTEAAGDGDATATDTQTADGAAADGTTGTDAAATDAATDGAATDAEGAATDDAAAGEGAAAAAEETPEPPTAPKPVENVDLSALEPFGKPDGATDEEWAKLQEDAAMFFDIDAGAAAGRAQRRLEAAGKNAWPAILNEMIKLDPANPDDNQQGMLAQRALNAARGSDTSMAFDWRTPDDSATGTLSDKNLRYNRKLIKKLYESWAKVVEDPTHWERIDKTEAQEEAKKREESKVDDEFSVDDLDLDDLEDLDG
ncbi:MAG: hypothetical protein AAGB93_24670, partial [Planctomycetota bacterium]